MIVWTEALATHNLIIDAEHRELVEFLNTIAALTIEQRYRACGRRFAVDLYQLTANHFAHEELLMKEFSYDKTARHAEIHKTLLTDFRAMIENFEEFGADLIVSSVEQWISHHLFKEDMLLAQFIQHNQRPEPTVHRTTHS